MASRCLLFPSSSSITIKDVGYQSIAGGTAWLSEGFLSAVRYLWDTMRLGFMCLSIERSSMVLSGLGCPHSLQHGVQVLHVCAWAGTESISYSASKKGTPRKDTRQPGGVLVIRPTGPRTHPAKINIASPYGECSFDKLAPIMLAGEGDSVG